MAEIRPIRVWRYNRELSQNIEDLTSPLFDVVSPSQRELLYKNPYNSIHLSVPKGDNPAESALRKVTKWKKDSIIKQDQVPGIYVYYQQFRFPGDKELRVRKGFVVNIRIYDWDEEVILRHENTMPFSVNDRLDLIKKTELNVAPTHGMYTDGSFELEKYMDQAIQKPIYDTEDYQGVRDTLGVIQDEKITAKFVQKLRSGQVIMADGHHRYAGSLENYKHRKADNPDHKGSEGYNFHLMYLTNSLSDTARILPTHRLITGLPGFNKKRILRTLEKFFTIKPVANPNDINEIIMGKKWAFGLLFKEDTYKIRLKPEVIDQIPWKFPRLINELDLTVLHYFVIEKALGIQGKDQANSRNILFERNFTSSHDKVLSGEVQLAMITQDITMEVVLQVCESGYTLPQKSTFFYPKVICGFLFSSIKENEFNPPPDTGL